MDTNEQYLVQCHTANLPNIKDALHRGAELNVENGYCLVAIIQGTGMLKEKKASLDYLLSHGGKIINSTDTLLTWAIKSKNIELVKYFLEKGLKPNNDDGMGIYMAMKNGDEVILSYLFAYGARVTDEVKEYFSMEGGEIPKCIENFSNTQDILLSTISITKASIVDAQQAALDYTYSHYDDCGTMLPHHIVFDYSSI
jgi:hypothetical protein